jgi:V/A-type H+-transporting ATPase subunit A
VSPPGGDFSEPVTLHTKRFVRCFWELDKELASARVFPAINVADSFSEYAADVEAWWRSNGRPEWGARAAECREMLQAARKLEQVAQLVGEEALPDAERVVLEGARLVREAFLQQDAFDPVDRFSSPAKTAGLLDVVLRWVACMREAVAARIPVYRLLGHPLRAALLRARFEIEGEGSEGLTALQQRLEEARTELLEGTAPGAGSEGGRR